MADHHLICQSTGGKEACRSEQSPIHGGVSVWYTTMNGEQADVQPGHNATIDWRSQTECSESGCTIADHMLTSTLQNLEPPDSFHVRWTGLRWCYNCAPAWHALPARPWPCAHVCQA